jgi:hypothetical protein
MWFKLKAISTNETCYDAIAYATVPEGNVTVMVHVDDLTPVSKLGKASVAGEGYIHYFIDVAAVPTAAGKPALTAAGIYYPTANTS